MHERTATKFVFLVTLLFSTQHRNTNWFDVPALCAHSLPVTVLSECAWCVCGTCITTAYVHVLKCSRVLRVSACLVCDGQECVCVCVCVCASARNKKNMLYNICAILITFYNYYVANL